MEYDQDADEEDNTLKRTEGSPILISDSDPDDQTVIRRQKKRKAEVSPSDPLSLTRLSEKNLTPATDLAAETRMKVMPFEQLRKLDSNSLEDIALELPFGKWMP